MKYIDADKLKYEIERHLNSAIEHQNANPDMPKHKWYLYEGAKELCTDLLGYLDDTFSEEPDKSLEEAAYKYSFDSRPSIYGQVDVIDAFKAGAEWQASQMPMPEDTVLFNKGVAEGRRLEREDMMKDAIHYVVQDDLDSHGASYNIPFIRIGIVALKPKGIGVGDKVKVIILKDNEDESK